MRVPLSWLKEFTPVPADARDRASITELHRVFDSLGLVVDKLEFVGDSIDDVVLARVIDIQPIPKADKVRHIFVDAGLSAPVEIVCGAWNFGVGDVVPLAPVGTVLPGDFAIAERKMRGVTSNGMLCSGKELGLDDDAQGLLVLGSEAEGTAAALQPGMKLVEYLGITPDVVFDLEVEPNRPDCLSVLGVARDIAARLKLPLHEKTPEIVESDRSVDEVLTVTIESPEACRRFTTRAIFGVADIASHPDVARRLTMCGMRPINAIVDASNYVMLEFGQPSHPYDLDRLSGGGFVVRLSHQGEELTTLDGEKWALGETTDPFGEKIMAKDLLICDATDQPIGLAGIMGGASTEIGPETTNIALEVADFDPLTIGRTAARLNHRTEASARFWRGTDRGGLERAVNRFCEVLIAAHRHAGVALPQVAKGIVDSHPGPLAENVVTVRTARLNEILGTSLSTKEIVAFLDPIGFSSITSGDILTVTIPTFRPDASREVDVIEEVMRQLGFEQLKKTERRSPYVGRLSNKQRSRRFARRALTGLSAHEAWTSSIVDPDLAMHGDIVKHIELTHPIVPKERALRTHLLPGLLGAVSYNTNHRNGYLRLFEIGHVFAQSESAEAPTEFDQLGVIFAFEDDDATTAVRSLRAFAENLGLQDDAFTLLQGATDGAVLSNHVIAMGCHPTRSAIVMHGENVIGAVGEVDPDYAASFGLERRIGWFVLDADQLFDIPRHIPTVDVVSHFPSSDIDLAFVVGEDVSAQRVEAVLREAAGEWCEFVRLVDIYRGASVPENTRSLAFRLRFCATDRTLTPVEIGELHSSCIQAVESTLGARLRS